MPFEAVISDSSSKTPFKYTFLLPAEYANVLPFPSAPLNEVWPDVAVYTKVVNDVPSKLYVTVPLDKVAVTPVPPANFNVSLPNVNTSVVDDESAIVKSEEAAAVVALVIRPWASTVITGIALPEP